jgi:hypothetical protein
LVAHLDDMADCHLLIDMKSTRSMSIFDAQS